MASVGAVHVLLNAASSTGAGKVLPVDGGGSVVMELVISDTATVTFQGTVDGTNWYSVVATELADNTVAATATASGLYRIDATAIGAVRPNVTTFGSGTVTARARTQYN